MGVLLRIPSRMVFKLSFAALILVPLIAGQPVGDECCQEKMVGPYEYKLANGYSGTVPRQCINTCVYTRVDNGRLYCFQPGEQHVECEDEGPTPPEDGEYAGIIFFLFNTSTVQQSVITSQIQLSVALVCELFN